LINKLVLENLKHRPVRTALSALAIGVQVAMVLTLVGLSNGMLADQQGRSRGVGADILIRAPGSSIIGFTENMPQKIVDYVRKQPHVALATGALIAPTGPLTSVTGLDLPEFSKMSGNFRYIHGGPLQQKNEVIVDEYYARQNKLHVGDTLTLLNRPWRLTGIYEPGKIARIIVDLSVLQDLTSESNKLTVIYVKLDNSSLTDQMISFFKAHGLHDYKIYSMEAFVSAISVSNLPMLREFIYVVIGIGVIVGFLVVFLSMYTAVLERTREIGVLKALGASRSMIVGILMRETTVLAIVGSIVGIGFSYLTRWVIATLVPGSLIQAIVPVWWPIAGGIAIFGALLGAAYPGWKAATQDAIEALAYD